MENKMFSFYDFLGYLIPGSFLMLMIGIIFNIEVSKKLELNIKKILELVKNLDVDKIFILIILMYILGHILSFLSAITVERYSIWTLGYPSGYLLGYKKKAYFQIEKNRLFRIPARILNFIFLFPITLLDLALSHSPLKMSKIVSNSLDEELQCTIRKCICKNLQEKYGINSFCHNINLDFLRILYHEVVENSKTHLPKIQNYVALYGFSRTIALILNISTYLFVYQAINNNFHKLLGLKIVIFITIFMSLLSFLMYCSYNKFSKKYTLEVLMAYLVINKTTDFNRICIKKCK